MPVYAFKGFDGGGKNVSGTRDADSAKAIKLALRKEGVFATEVKQSGAKSKDQEKKSARFSIGGGVSAQELAVATRQLATLVGAGITLVQSLTALVDQVDNEGFKIVFADVKSRVNEGAGFADALSAHPKIFTELYVSMVQAGEHSGALDVVLERLADFTESQAELRGKLIGTMIYPVIMVIMSLVVTGILFTFVIPKITKIFESQKMVLPLPTLVVMGLSNFFKDYWWLILPAMGGMAFGVSMYLKSKSGRLRWDKFILKAPVFGPLVRMVAIARFSRTLATLLASGVPLLTAFDIVKAVVQNSTLRSVIEKARDAVKEGEDIAQPLKRSGEFPPMVTHMISIGEKSGELEGMLGNIAASYESQVDRRLSVMTSLLEPALIVMMGIIVTIIVMAIILPMLEMTSMASG